MTPIRTSLARHLPASVATPAEIEAMRRRAWHEQGLVVLVPGEIADDWTRQAVINEATRRYGKRRAR